MTTRWISNDAKFMAASRWLEVASEKFPKEVEIWQAIRDDYAKLVKLDERELSVLANEERNHD